MPQFGLIRQATRAFDLPCIEMEGFRGRRSDRHLCQARPRGRRRHTIISSDKDLMQARGTHGRHVRPDEGPRDPG